MDKAKKTVIKQIVDNLVKNGFETYFPTQHKGDCLTEYIVVEYAGAVSVETVSSVADTYQLLCYVQENRYSRIMDFSEEVRKAMRDIFPLVRETGNQSTTYFDETIKGHLIVLEYVNYRKILYRN